MCQGDEEGRAGNLTMYELCPHVCGSSEALKIAEYARQGIQTHRCMRDCAKQPESIGEMPPRVRKIVAPRGHLCCAYAARRGA